MSTSTAQNDVEYVAVDASELEEGDEVIVSDVAESGQTRGVVAATKNECGRYAVDIDEDPDGLGAISRFWEQTGRTWTRVEQ